MYNTRYKTYRIQGSTAYVNGYKMHYPCKATIDSLRSLGVNEIVWRNGDFLLV